MDQALATSTRIRSFVPFTRRGPTAWVSACRSLARSSNNIKGLSGPNHWRHRGPVLVCLAPTGKPCSQVRPTSRVCLSLTTTSSCGESLCVLLEMLGFRVKAFGTPGGFLRLYRPEMAGCLILDIRMPRQSGLELYEQMLNEGKRIPVIFITANADVATAVAAMKTGAVEFLEKPFARAALLDRVRKALALDAQWRQRNAEFAELSAALPVLISATAKRSLSSKRV